MSNYRAHIEKSEISGMPTATFEGRIITIDTVADTVDELIAFTLDVYGGKILQKSIDTASFHS